MNARNVLREMSVHHALVVLRLSQIKCKYQIQSIVKA